MKFEIVGAIANPQVIASGIGVRIRSYLRKAYGAGGWRKTNGIATIRLSSGALRFVELHWHEAHGIGKRDVKIRRYVSEP